MLKERGIITNDNTKMVPLTEYEGRVLKYDFPELQVGIAEYKEGPTGCTVFYFPKDAISVADVRGGFPGTIGGSSAEDGRTSAICFAGGSAYGLEAATGVASEIFSMRGYFGVYNVRGAVIYDFFRNNMIYPDKELGRAAMRSAKTGIFPLGFHGVGCWPGCGTAFDCLQPDGTGQGGAFQQIGVTKLAVFTVVNSLGVIVDRQGNIVRGNYDRGTGKRYHYSDLLERRLANNARPEPHYATTTLTLIVTNQKLDIESLRQLSRQVHSSMARAIQPFHTKDDGDVLYAVTTNEVENDILEVTDLGVIASELAWDAILSCFQGYDSSGDEM
jgi:L-aminopeptidase/D-esterase-like protein